MPQADSLKRLGGGRWETKDGRFQIEPQSGTWVIVDTTQTNEFGLPLVRGPYPSLGAAKDAIESARGEGRVTSPLAERIEKAGKEPAESAADSNLKPKKEGGTGRREAAKDEPPEPPAPPEPAWLRDLKPVGRQKATALIERLEKLGIDDAEAIARAEIAEGEPALTRLALERSITAAIKSKRDPRSAVAAAVEAIMAGEDVELEVEWSLVDDRGRRIEGLDVDR